MTAALLLGCSDGTSPTAELHRAMERWEDSGIASYSMNVRFLCGECMPEVSRQVIVTVRDGAVESRVFADDGAAVGEELASVWPTVDGLFTRILDLITDRPHRLDVRYHPTIGFPESISADPVRNVADDEHGWVVSQFTIIP